jgi:AAA15 family ATPase/GTPase
LPPKTRANIAISLEPEVLVASLGAKLKVAKLKLIRDWFRKNVFLDFGDPAENFFLSINVPNGFEDDERVQRDVLSYFSSFDDSIQGFHVEKIPAKSDKDKERLRIDAFHKAIDSDEAASIPLELESGGTLKMFALYPGLQSVLKNGSVLFVDELNARLHPLLVRNFIQTFLNPQLNPNNAQLIFTTHDTWQLSNDLLRRDEIWFAEKDSDGVSALYSLADFIDETGVKIRKDENYEKNYLLGKYGAIPALKSFEVFGE